MAGSNGSPAQRGDHAAQWPAETDEQARALELERWHQHQAQQRAYQQAQQGYATPGAYAHPSHGDPAHPPHGYAPPHVPDFHAPGLHAPGYPAPVPRNPFDTQGYPDSAGAPPPPAHFAPHFERYTPPQPPAHGHFDPRAHHDPHAYPPAMAEAPLPPVHDPFDPLRAPQQFDPHHGYAPSQQQPPFQGHHDPRSDLQHWDLSHYQPGQIPQGYAPQPGHHAPGAHPEWQQPHGGHEPAWQQPHPGHAQWQHPDAAHGHQHYDAGAPGHYPPTQLDPGYDPRGAHEPGADMDEMEAPEEPRRGPGTVLIVSMLVGAIVVGGGLAFAYKQFGGGGKTSAKVAEIKRQTTPEKVRPVDPGGRTMEHSDKKFLNRLATDAPTSEQRQSDIEGATKKVSTIPIVVNRDGSLSPQPAASAPEAPSSGVPGLLIDGLGPPPVPAAQAPRLRGNAASEPVVTQTASRLPPPPPAEPSAAPTARAAPRVADLPLPKVTNSPPPVTAAVERAAAARPARDDFISQRDSSAAAAGASGLGAPAAAPRKPAPAASSSGYVAVLASKRSRQDALNTFADLHAQYPDILGGITPDVREANLGDKGVWYRLIGGPPGSREAARSICVKLKAKGMKDCWPVAY